MLLALTLLLTTPNLPSLYSSLDPTSVSEHFAFYELYPKTVEGKAALKHAWDLLSGGCSDCDPELILPSIDPTPFIQFLNRSSEEPFPTLSEESLAVIEKLSRPLKNRTLLGFGKWDLSEALTLPPDQIDVSRTLLLAELGGGADTQAKIRSYEASLDLMALQIQARLPEGATPLDKIGAINHYIFSEMRFRFPPHSLYAKEIDLYTFLPSVLDQRRGVCLGVSLLYLSLAQRLSLPLEAITPPGHIYVRYRSPDGEIVNIETTARGIDIPSEMYLGLETKKLQERTYKEAVGLAFMNQAAVAWHQKEPGAAIPLYEKARLFLGDDYLLNLFLGLNYLFAGREGEGKALLEKVKGVIPDHQIAPDTLSEDFLAGKVDIAALETIFLEVDEKRESILAKQKKLEEVVQKWPHFRQGIFHLATTWLQLGREKEAIPLLERYISLYPADPTVNYYLAAIHFGRHNFPEAWRYLEQAEKLVQAKGHSPRALEALRQSLQRACPSVPSKL